MSAAGAAACCEVEVLPCAEVEGQVPAFAQTSNGVSTVPLVRMFRCTAHATSPPTLALLQASEVGIWGATTAVVPRWRRAEESARGWAAMEALCFA